MKKLFYFLFALAAMLLTNTSCSDDLENSVTSDNEATVSFKVQLESAVNSRAVGDGTTAKELQYAVYKVDATGKTIGTEIAALAGKTTVDSDLKATVTLTLVKGQTYNFLFWAQSPNNNYYDLNKANGTITVKYDGIAANDEKRDAFFKVRKDLKVTGPINETIVLKRPFAQVNVGTTIGSLTAAKKADTEITNSSFTIKNAATTLNAYTGAATVEKEVTFSSAAIIESNKADNVGDLKNVASKDYEYLAMNYILVASDENDEKNSTDAYGVGENKALVNATLTLYAGETEINTFEIPNVPVQRNFRTNIIGEIMNANVTFNVVVDPNFDGEHNYNTNEELEYILKNGGTYTFTQNKTFDKTLVVNANAAATLNLNGYTLTLDTESDFGINNEGGTLTIKNGKIEDKSSIHTAIYNNKGSLTLDDVEVTAASARAITTNGYDYVSVPCEANNKPFEAFLTINGGKVSTTSDSSDPEYAIQAWGYSKVIINGTEVTGKYGALNIQSSSAELNGGTYTATNKYYGLFVFCAEINYTDNCVFNGATHDIYVQYKGTDNLLYNSYINGVKITETKAFNPSVSNETELNAALTAGGLVTLTDNVTLTSALTVSNDVTLNLNGKTLTLAKAETVTDVNVTSNCGLKNTATLKIINGTISYSEGNDYSRNAAIINEGVLELDNVNLTSDVFCIRATGPWTNEKTLQEQGEVTVKTIINGGSVKSTATAHDSQGRHIYAIYGLDNSLLSVDGATIEGDGGIAINCANVELKNTTVKAKCSNNCAYCLYMEGAANATVAESCTLTSTSVKVYAYDKWENKYGTIVYNDNVKTTGVVVE